MNTIRVNWEGSLFVHHSLGMVNREILIRLLEDTSLSVGNVPFEQDLFDPPEGSRLYALKAVAGRAHAVPEVWVRHRWPPEFARPAGGAVVFFQPWEYGALPVEWVKKVPELVDEVWVYTDYLRQCYIASGLPSKMVHVVPLGVNEEEFQPGAIPMASIRERAADRFCFLFNGGITLRKGADILINAYLNEFRANEKVCLVIKGSNAYKKGLAQKVAELAARTDIAPIIYLTDDVEPEALPSLYTACDCYVQPYRAEGYGLPVAEAMACARPVIVTGAGACRDFTNEDTCYLIKCSKETFPGNQVDGIPTVAPPFWIKPDTDDLRRLMRHVFENRDEAREKGERAGRTIRANHTWKQTAEKVKERIMKNYELRITNYE